MKYFFIIGFASVGKSYWGKYLAKCLNIKFMDTDTEIQRLHHKSVTAIFNELGEDKFRDIEASVLDALIKGNQQHNPIIISTGGGTPCFKNNMEFMKQHGTVIWLQASKKTLFERLSQGQSRPLTQGMSSTDLEKYIDKTLETRSKEYKKAHYQVYQPKSLDDFGNIFK